MALWAAVGIFSSLFFSFFFFWWPSFFLMDSLTRSTPPSPSIHSVFLFFFSFWFMTCFLFRSKKKWNEAWSPVLCSPNILSDQKLFTKERFLKWTLFIPSKFSNQANGKCKCLTCKLKLLLNWKKKYLVQNSHFLYLFLDYNFISILTKSVNVHDLNLFS